MKIYTKTGDQGRSSLFSGERVRKTHYRIHAYGDVDELNSVIGALMAAVPPSSKGLYEQLQGLQETLFQVGAVLATSQGSARAAQLAPVSADHTRTLEGYIDAYEAGLPVLKSFILPGGHMSAAWAHIARTVCRRAERSVVGLVQELEADGLAPDEPLAQIMIYLNRLSDYFFVVARHCNAAAGVDDVSWQG
jgi:cob(I)alamin adenosyltransferase